MKTNLVNPAIESQHHSGRVISLDVLRGFAMFWIIGTDHLVRGLKDISDSSVARFASGQFTHASWEGFTFYDHIFPLFLFVMGASLVLSLDKTLAFGDRGAAVNRIFRRFVLLYVLGMIADGGVEAMGEENIFMGVLQRIAWCYLFSGVLYLTLGTRTLIAVCATTLAFYWAILSFVPLPGVEEISFEKHRNWPNYIDSYLINTFFIPSETHRVRYDPEGVLSTFPATLNCLFGVFAGLLLKSSLTDRRKVCVFVLIGIGMLVFGHLWGTQFPIVKRLWTSSYALVGGGWSFLLLGATYFFVDICKWQRGFSVFVWIGANSLAIYMAVHLINFENIAARIFGGPVAATFGEYGNLVNATAAVGLAVYLCYLFYRQRIFVRV
ncbi:MAG: acyltransferase family protein [Pseudomonadales bacterium]